MPLAPTTEKFDQQVRLKQRNNGKWYLCTPPPRGEVEDVRLAVTVYLGLPQTTPITHEVAREAARKLAGERARGLTTTPDQMKITVAEVLQVYQEELEGSGHESARTINVSLRWLRPRVGGYRVAHLTTPRLHALARQWQKAPEQTSRQADGRLASSTIAFRCGWLIAALKHAEVLGLIGKHQIPSMPKFQRREKRKNFLEPEEFYGHRGAEADGVLAQYDTFKRKIRARHYRDATEWGYVCGWRSREIRELRWEWIYAGEIRLPAWLTKNRDGRNVPLVAQLAALLERRRPARSYIDPAGVRQLSAYVFHQGNGKRLDGKSLVRYFRQAIQAAPACRDDVRHFIFHDLRRCAVSNLIRAGVTRKVAMSITGHKSEKVFTDYQILSGEEQRDALAQVHQYTRDRLSGGRPSGTVLAFPDNRPDNVATPAAQGGEL